MRHFLSILLLVCMAAYVWGHPSAPFAIAVGTEAWAKEGTPLPVVMYHHIRERRGLGQDVIAPEEFAADLDELARRGFHTVTLAQILAHQQSGAPLPEKPVLLTFDDGFESALYYATPELAARSMSAVMFVLTSQTDAYEGMAMSQRHVSYAYLDWGELAELAASGAWEIGNHSHALHYAQAGGGRRKGALPLPGESDADYLEALRRDIGAAQEKLASHLGTAPSAFAYPYGFYSKRSEKALEALGFTFTFVTEKGVSRITDDPASLRAIKRVNRPHGVRSADFFDALEAMAR